MQVISGQRGAVKFGMNDNIPHLFPGHGTVNQLNKDDIRLTPRTNLTTFKLF